MPTPKKDPLTPHREEVLAAQLRYEAAKLRVLDLLTEKSKLDAEAPVVKAAALERLTAPVGPFTKTDAPKYLHTDAAYAEFSARCDVLDLERAKSETSLSIVRNRLYTARLILASYLPGNVLASSAGSL